MSHTCKTAVIDLDAPRSPSLLCPQPAPEYLWTTAGSASKHVLPDLTFQDLLNSLASRHQCLEDENWALRAQLLQAEECTSPHITESRDAVCHTPLCGYRSLMTEAVHSAAPELAPPDDEALMLPVTLLDRQCDAIQDDCEKVTPKQCNSVPEGECESQDRNDLENSCGLIHDSPSNSSGSVQVLAIDEDKKSAISRSKNDFKFEWTRKPIFANADDMKERVRQQIAKKAHNERDFYKQSGITQRVVTSSTFETATLLVISFNALWIAVDTDGNREDLLIKAGVMFQVMENLFCVYFFVEIVLRFGAIERKRNCLRDPWFLFDFCLVAMMVIETWVMTLIILATSGVSQTTELGDATVLRLGRLLRLTRMARMARLFRLMPELVILVKGVVAAARSVFFTLVLLCILLYVFGIVCTQLLRDTDVGGDFFNSVPRSMMTLWVRLTLLDEFALLLGSVEKASIPCSIALHLFILAAALTVMNMLVGVLCEVVSAVAASEREELSLNVVRARLHRILKDLGLGVGMELAISKDEFVQIVENQEAARAIQELGVDVVGLVDFAEVFFETDAHDDIYGKALSFAEFMEAVISLRGSNVATVKDIMDLRKALVQCVTQSQKQVEDLRQSTSQYHQDTMVMRRSMRDSIDYGTTSSEVVSHRMSSKVLSKFNNSHKLSL